MVRATGELASVVFESEAHASRRRRRCSVEIGRSVGVVGPKSPECSATVGSTLENRDGDVEEGRTTVAPARVPWAMPWRGVVWAASDAADSCEAFAKLLRNRIQTRRGTAEAAVLSTLSTLSSRVAVGYIENVLNSPRTPAPHLLS